MNVVRIEAAPPYEAPGHDRMRMARLQGREAGPADTMWLGLSRIAPGGGTTLDAAAVEKILRRLGRGGHRLERERRRDARRAGLRPHRTRRVPAAYEQDRSGSRGAPGDAGGRARPIVGRSHGQITRTGVRAGCFRGRATLTGSLSTDADLDRLRPARMRRSSRAVRHGREPVLADDGGVSPVVATRLLRSDISRPTLATRSTRMCAPFRDRQQRG